MGSLPRQEQNEAGTMSDSGAWSLELLRSETNGSHRPSRDDREGFAIPRALSPPGASYSSAK